MKIAVVKFNCGHADMKDAGEERKGKGRGKDAQKNANFYKQSTTTEGVQGAAEHSQS